MDKFRSLRLRCAMRRLGHIILLNLACLLGFRMIGMCLTPIIYGEVDATCLMKDYMPRP
jgi:hypothetical protein